MDLDAVRGSTLNFGWLRIERAGKETLLKEDLQSQFPLVKVSGLKPLLTTTQKGADLCQYLREIFTAVPHQTFPSDSGPS